MNSSVLTTASGSLPSFDISLPIASTFSLIIGRFSQSYKTETLNVLKEQLSQLHNISFSEEELVQFLYYLALWIDIQKDDSSVNEVLLLLEPIKEKIRFPYISFQTVLSLYFQDKIQWERPDVLDELSIFVVVIKIGSGLFDLKSASVTIKLLSVMVGEDLGKILDKEISGYFDDFFENDQLKNEDFYYFTIFLSKLRREFKKEQLAKHFKKIMIYLEGDETKNQIIKEPLNVFLQRVNVFKYLPKMSVNEVRNVHLYLLDQIRKVEDLDDMNKFNQVIFLYPKIFKKYGDFIGYGLMSICFYHLKSEWVFDPSRVRFIFSSNLQARLIENFVEVVENELRDNWDLALLSDKIKAVDVFCNIPNFTDTFFLSIITRKNLLVIEQKLELINLFRSNFNPLMSNITSLVQQLFFHAPPNLDLISLLTRKKGAFISHGDKYDPLILSLFNDHGEWFQIALCASIFWWGRVVVQNLARLEGYRISLMGNFLPIDPFRLQLLLFLKLLFEKIPPSGKKEFNIFIQNSENICRPGTSCLLWENEAFIIVAPESLPPI